MLERIPDVVDQGSHLAETERASLEAAHRRRAAPRQVKNADGTWPITKCEECGDAIGAKRLEAVGAVTCIHCASRMETERKRYGKR